MASLLSNPCQPHVVALAPVSLSSNRASASLYSSAQLSCLRGSSFGPLHHVRAQAPRRRGSTHPLVVASADESPAVEDKPSVTSPFAGKKISALLAARAAAASKASDSSSAASAAAASAAAGLATPKPPAFDPSAPPPPAPLTSSFAQILPAAPASPTSPFAAPASPTPASAPTAAAARPSVNAISGGSVKPTVSFRGKAIVDAYKQGSGSSGAPGSAGKASASAASRAASATTMTEDGRVRVGVPRAPSNIFQEQARTPEEVEAEKWRFQVSRDQVLLAASFFASSLIMLGMVYLVWKLGAIHFNEI